MPLRIQVIIDEEDVAKFKLQARRESKSLSAWLREAGQKMIKMNESQQPLSSPDELKAFFDQCAKREQGVEPEWEEHKALLSEGFQAGRAV